MNTQDLSKHLGQPGSLDTEAREQLERLIGTYPYFSAARLMLARSYRNTGDPGFGKALKAAALYAGDRSVLYNYLDTDVAEVNRVIEEENTETAPLNEIKEEETTVNMEEPETVVEMQEEKPVENTVNATPVELPATTEYNSPPIEMGGVDTGGSEDEFALTYLDDREEGKKEEISAEFPEDPELHENVHQPESTFPEARAEDITAPAEESPGTIIEAEPEIIPSTEVHEETPSPEFHEYTEIKDTIKEPEITGIIKEEESPAEEIISAADREEEDTPVISGLEVEETFPLDPTSFDKDYDAVIKPTFIPENRKNGKMEKEEPPVQKAGPIGSDEKHSFNSWFERLEGSPKKLERHTSSGRPDPGSKDNHKQRPEEKKQKSKKEIIDRFLEELPAINKPQAEFYKPQDMARQSEQFHEDEWATETLAKIYAGQGHKERAILIYEKLQVKFPEKKSYFSDLIKELQNKH